MKAEEIKVYRKNEFGFVVDGKPVTPEFRPDLHVNAKIKPLQDLPQRDQPPVPVHGFETPICAYAAMGIRPS